MVRLIKSSGLARIAHRTANARRSGRFLRPENEHVILGRGTSGRLNTRGRWMASSPPPSGTVLDERHQDLIRDLGEQLIGRR